MKIHLLVLPALLGICMCDEDQSSSYSVLPYENEIQPQHLPQNYYNYYDGNDEKKKFSFGRIVRAPFKALKGAGNYMMGMFDDVRSKFLELNGSFLRAKGDILKYGGENILKTAFKSYPRKNYLAAQTYYSPYQSGPKYEYNNNPKPIYPYKVSEEEADPNSIDNLSLKDAEFHDGSNNIDSTYNEARDDSVTSGFSRRKNDFSESLHKFKDFTPSERDFTFRNANNQRDYSVYNVARRPPYPLQKAQKREFVRQRSAKNYPDTQRTQRSYHVVGGGYDFGRPIPVPVPIAINPAQLVFPSIQELNPVIGY